LKYYTVVLSYQPFHHTTSGSITFNSSFKGTKRHSREDAYAALGGFLDDHSTDNFSTDQLLNRDAILIDHPSTAVPALAAQEEAPQDDDTALDGLLDEIADLSADYVDFIDGLYIPLPFAPLPGQRDPVPYSHGPIRMVRCHAN
jgi:hypothetical protein